MPEDPLQRQLHPAGGRQYDQTEIDDLKQGDEKKGAYRPRSRDVRLVEPDLAHPAANMEGVCHADEDVDGSEKDGVTGREPPWQQDQGENGDAVR